MLWNFLESVCSPLLITHGLQWTYIWHTVASFQSTNPLLPALIHSGAAISVIRTDVFGKLGNSSQSFKLEASDIQASAINGTTLRFKGMCLLPCRWFKSGPIFFFQVLHLYRFKRSLCCRFRPFTQGKMCSWFLSRILDVGNAVLECVSPLAQWYERNSQTAQIALCSVSDRFLIPARSEAHVKCRLKSDHAHKFLSSTRTSSTRLSVW